MATQPDLPPEALLQAARHAMATSHSPYSSFPVGAALLSADGRLVTGANIENISYGLSMCAERVALFKAVSEGIRDFAALAVVAANTPHHAVSPCGACRQVLAEFLKPDCPICFFDATGQVVSRTLGDLLPEAFDSLE